MNTDSLHFVFTGGGTGGHLFPGLAVAQRLVDRMPRTQITFVGSGKPLERRHVAAAGFEYFAVRCRQSPKRLREVISFVAENLAGYLAARRFLRRRPADAVVGLGGYASVPMARAACRLGVPLVLLEQNAVPGKATRWLARSASLVCLAMPKARCGLRCRCPVRVTGNPIRSSHHVPRDQAPSSHLAPRDQASSRGARRLLRRLLILGGSGGARSLNENVPRALHHIRAELDGWQIVHQSGQSGFETTRRLYGQLDLPATVVHFLDDVPDVLAETDLAVSRAGGTTLSELAAAAVPAVLLPYPHAADDHQRHNADAFTAAGGCTTLDRRELSGRLDEHLADALSQLLGSPQRRARMSAAMGRLARPQAADDVAALILEVITGQAWQSPMPAAA